jgi:hypothetical protein
LTLNLAVYGERNGAALTALPLLVLFGASARGQLKAGKVNRPPGQLNRMQHIGRNSYLFYPNPYSRGSAVPLSFSLEMKPTHLLIVFRTLIHLLAVGGLW